MTVYFDNSATTKVSPAAAQKALELMETCYGNPSSLHSLGFQAEKEISSARENLAGALGVESGEIYFTSGGTESNNLAVFGAAMAKKRLGSKIVTSAIEHPSLLEMMKQLEKEGFVVTYLQPQADGNISPHTLEQALTKDTVLVSLMSVNNETGAMLPLSAVQPLLKRCGSQAVFHVDHVQGFGKIKLNRKRLGIDLMSLSGHKIHAPKGVGALYVKKGLRLMPRAFGGGQEKNLRPGTENVPGIGAFGQAVLELPAETAVARLNQKLRTGLAAIPGIVFNSPENASPYILNFSLGKIKGETMLHFLAERGIYVSTGSACSGGGMSHVLTAMGCERERVASALRLSFSAQNTLEEADVFLRELQAGINALAHI